MSMKDQAQMMNQQTMMNQAQMMSLSQPPIMSQQPQVMSNHQKSHVLMSQPQLLNPSQIMMNQSQSSGIAQSQMLNRGSGYGMWPTVGEQLKFQNPMKPPGFVSSSKPIMGRNKNWKGNKGIDKRKRNEKLGIGGVGGSAVGHGVGSGSGAPGSGVGGGYKPPTLMELQQQNRLKARRYFPKKKFNNNSRSAPYAPRNTTSFIIRAKKEGGITSLVSPCPVTPAVLPTPNFSPSREVLVDMAKEEWGVDGYGSMKGLIRLRSPGHEAEAVEDEDEDEGGSSESDVEEHVEVERRLDHDLSRFEMIYPNACSTEHSNYLLENRVDDQDAHIAQLEEENLILKERLFLMEREFDDLRRRLQFLERQNQVPEDVNEEVMENDSGSESREYGRSMEDNDEVVEENIEGSQIAEAKDCSADAVLEAKEAKNVEPKENSVDGDVKAYNAEANVDAIQKMNTENFCMEQHMLTNENDIEERVKQKQANGNDIVEAKEADSVKDLEAEQGSITEASLDGVRDVSVEGLGPVKEALAAKNGSNDQVMGEDQ